MKIVLLFLSIILFFTPKNVPEVVKSAFAGKYPNVKKVRWEQRGENFEAEFKNGKTEIEVLFTPSGNWMYTATEIDRRKLPVEVINGFREQGFSDWKLDEAGVVETPLFKDAYIIEAEKDESSYDLFFDKDGKLLQKLFVKRGK
jgi:hypothetical protein